MEVEKLLRERDVDWQMVVDLGECGATRTPAHELRNTRVALYGSGAAMPPTMAACGRALEAHSRCGRSTPREQHSCFLQPSVLKSRHYTNVYRATCAHHLLKRRVPRPTSAASRGLRRRGRSHRCGGRHQVERHTRHDDGAERTRWKTRTVTAHESQTRQHVLAGATKSA